MSGIRYHRLLERDLAQAITFYERRVEGLGKAFFDEFNDAVLRAASSPLAGSPMRGTVRRQLLHRFPYSVVYNIEEDGILVLTVMHQRRHPNTWQRRLRSGQ